MTNIIGIDSFVDQNKSLFIAILPFVSCYFSVLDVYALISLMNMELS